MSAPSSSLTVAAPNLAPVKPPIIAAVCGFSPPPSPPPLYPGGGDANILSGKCTAYGACVRSPNHPSDYGNSERCLIVPPPYSMISARRERNLAACANTETASAVISRTPSMRTAMRRPESARSAKPAPNCPNLRRTARWQCSVAAVLRHRARPRDILRISNRTSTRDPTVPTAITIPGSPQTIEWSSDGSVTASGWELCATPLPDGPRPRVSQYVRIRRRRRVRRRRLRCDVRAV